MEILIYFCTIACFCPCSSLNLFECLLFSYFIILFVLSIFLISQWFIFFVGWPLTIIVLVIFFLYLLHLHYSLYNHHYCHYNFLFHLIVWTFIFLFLFLFLFNFWMQFHILDIMNLHLHQFYIPCLRKNILFLVYQKMHYLNYILHLFFEKK